MLYVLVLSQNLIWLFTFSFARNSYMYAKTWHVSYGQLRLKLNEIRGAACKNERRSHRTVIICDPRQL